MNSSEIVDAVNQRVSSSNDKYNEIYEAKFASYFSDVRDLYAKFECEYRPITDDELEQILTTVALKLFSVSEELNEIKLSVEVLKLEVKSAKALYIASSSLETQKAKKENADIEYLELDVQIKILEAVIARVEREMTYSRELIMSSKKIWASRKNTESLPISEGTSDFEDLPDYTVNTDIL